MYKEFINMANNSIEVVIFNNKYIALPTRLVEAFAIRITLNGFKYNKVKYI